MTTNIFTYNDNIYFSLYTLLYNEKYLLSLYIVLYNEKYIFMYQEMFVVIIESLI